MHDADALARAAALLGRARRVLVLTGAGISTESGIPDFRSPGGIWSRYDPTELTFDRFCASRDVRRRYWQLATESYPVLRDARPNPAHLALVDIERAGKLLLLVTQNVDGLHHRAGSDPSRIIEIHGSSLRAGCITCGAAYDREALHRRVLAGEEAPECDACGGPLKPATVSFGQAMPEAAMVAAFQAARSCDLAMVIGSSLVVYPAAAIPEEAVRCGAPLVIINNEPTDKDALSEVRLGGSAGESMSLLVRMAGLGGTLPDASVRSRRS